MKTLNSIDDSFFWFVGVVEDVNDPIRLGRCRVRVFSLHTDSKEDIPTDDLPWAQPIQSITSAAMGDIGHSPTGIVNGTWVVGFFLDGEEAQRPVIMGTLAGIPTENANKNLGFNDPSGQYPERTGEPDVNRLARNDSEYPHPVINNKDITRKTSVPIAGGGTWNEPQSSYNAQYPKNHVYESEAGHIKEFDDTPGAERIHEYHGTTGTFYEVHPSGDKQTRIEGDSYTVIAGDDYVRVNGNVNLYIDSNCNTKIKNNWTIEVGGNMDISIDGSLTETVCGGVREVYKTNHVTQTSGISTAISDRIFASAKDDIIYVAGDKLRGIAPDIILTEIADDDLTS